VKYVGRGAAPPNWTPSGPAGSTDSKGIAKTADPEFPR
jgi:hypothetical protein